ncbi:hypothetical protein H8B02_23305 [Bradyrhizobium sp. Pear77]|uniref:hypothetical protein n=1 Tax=Bradyrhizobium altum TaxID=1571202 RepID=UPI001E29DAD8|nr:hypothetical protein [Bradyrhizobium altum]MCC8956248.1 hypothetical protein [Bradyrhizobium altum]
MGHFLLAENGLQGYISAVRSSIDHVEAVSERAGAGFEPSPLLEERPLPGLEVDIFVSGSGSFKRTERAVLLPARCCTSCNERSSGFAEP